MIDLETYNKLKSIKKNKSFTEIINELLDLHNIIPMDLLGVLSNKNDKIEYASIKKSREDRDVSI